MYYINVVIWNSNVWSDDNDVGINNTTFRPNEINSIAWKSFLSLKK